MKSVVLDAGDYSLDQATLGGIGLRVTEIAETLATEFQVTVMSSNTTGAVPGIEVETDAKKWDSLVKSSKAIFFFDTPNRLRMESAHRERRLIISENAPPIEHMEYPRIASDPLNAEIYLGHVAVYRRQLEISHHFLCRSHAERATLLASLCTLGLLTPADIGHSRTLAHKVSLVPIGYSQKSLDDAAKASEIHRADFLWTGGLWEYYNPTLLVDAIARCRDEKRHFTAAFLYAQISEDNRAVVEGLARHVAHENLSDQIELIADMSIQANRDSYIKGAHALVCIAKPGIENQTAVRLRVRDSRLHRRPMVIDAHGATADEVRRDGLGVVLKTDSADELASCLKQAAKTIVSSKAQNYCYSDTLHPTIEWIWKELS